MDYKQYFLDTLRSTSRKGVESVIENLEKLGFFSAPASSNFHLNTEGGLLQHSVNVCVEALKLRDSQIELRLELEQKLPVDSVIISALLHDVCKAEIYKKALKNRKIASGRWEEYWGYSVDYSDFPVGHGEKSVIRLLQWGMELKEDEICAIRWHMHAWDLAFHSPEAKNNLNAAKDKCPLLTLIIAADSFASFLLEAR